MKPVTGCGMRDAVISDCGQYRYVLTRKLPSILRWVRPILFIMLNPSTADATGDDPTIRRCIKFGERYECTDLTVVNLFALRSTEPKNLLTHPEPIGPDNDRHIQEQIAKHSLGYIIAAWGAHPFAKDRAKAVSMFGRFQCLRTTKSGAPRHPLYVKGDQIFKEFRT